MTVAVAVRVGAADWVGAGVLVDEWVGMAVGLIVGIAVSVDVGTGAANASPPSRNPITPPRSISPTAINIVSQRDIIRIYAAEACCATRLLGSIRYPAVVFSRISQPCSTAAALSLASG